MINLLTEGLDIMMEQLGVDIPEFVFWIIIVMLIISALKLLWKNEISPLLKVIHELDAKLDKTDKIDILEKQQQINTENYQRADNEINQKISVISERIDLLCDKLDKKISDDKEIKRGEIKDRIRQSYGYYHTRGYISSMELEALKGLINSYEKSGGANSFVHSVVEPEMYTWEVRD